MKSYLAIGLNLPPTKEDSFPHVTIIPPFEHEMELDRVKEQLIPELKKVSPLKTLYFGRVTTFGPTGKPIKVRLVQEPNQIEYLKCLRHLAETTLISALPGFELDQTWDFNPHCSASSLRQEGEVATTGLFLRTGIDGPIPAKNIRI